MAIRSASAFISFKYFYTLFLYTTPYIAYSILLSGIYIFALKAGGKIRAGKLPLFPDPRKRSTLSLVVGAEHHPAGTLRWLGIPERKVFTGVEIVGAVPLKNRIRAKAGVDITSGLRTPDCPQPQAQLIQSNCPSSTKGLNQV